MIFAMHTIFVLLQRIPTHIIKRKTREIGVQTSYNELIKITALVNEIKMDGEDNITLRIVTAKGSKDQDTDSPSSHIGGASSHEGQGHYTEEASSVPVANQFEIPPHPLLASRLQVQRGIQKQQSSPYSSGNVKNKTKIQEDIQSCSKNNPGVRKGFIASALQKGTENDTTEMKKRLDRLEHMWERNNTKDKSNITSLLQQYFRDISNPFALVIFLVEKSAYFHVNKTTTLAYHIMKEFDIWCRTNRSSLEALLTPDLRLQALRMSTRYHTILFNLAVDAFQLNHQGNGYLVCEIRHFLDNKKYKEVAVCAGKLGLQDHFAVEEVVLPLILQDRVNLIENYLCGNPGQQQLAVQLMDKICDRDFKLNDLISSRSDVPNLKTKAMNKKTLSKLAIRLMKLYDIPQELCPNISNARGLGALRFLLYKRYIEGTMGAGGWEELVQNAVGDNVYLQEQLVESLVCYNELQAAAKWANFYNFPDDKLNPLVVEQRRLIEQGLENQPASKEGEENWEDEVISQEVMRSCYYRLSLGDDHITLVDTPEKYQACISAISKPGSTIGIDSEWRPSFGSTIQRIALIQLAVIDHIYLVDVKVLMNVLTEDDWMMLVMNLFCNPELLKLGYGIESDFKMFVKTFPFMKEALIQMKRVVDLEKLAKLVVDKVVSLIPETTGDSDDEGVEDTDSGVMVKFQKQEERGLSELVRQCLGKPLAKTEQMSDWERRPLRKEQVAYAALDAHVLLEVYKVMVNTAKKENLQVDLEPMVSMKWCKDSRQDKLKAKAKGIKLQKVKPKPCLPSSHTRPMIPPGELQIVVDSMLQGLGRQLRSCGVDVRILQNHEDHEAAIKICQNENRIVLTLGSPYQMIRAHVGDHMCYYVQSETAREQVLEVLEYFNVNVKKEDIFSRCQVDL